MVRHKKLANYALKLIHTECYIFQHNSKTSTGIKLSILQMKINVVRQNGVSAPPLS